MAKKLTVIDLFCGVGGMSLGFKKAGFDVIWGVDVNKSACDAFQRNLKCDVTCSDIRLIKKFPKSDVVIGCYPCEGFSLAGKRDINDPRNYLYKEFARCVSQVRPKAFLVENVKGMLTLGSGKIWKSMIIRYKKLGYDVFPTTVNAKYFGVPQDRERILIAGFRKDLRIDFKFPEYTHGSEDKPFVTLRQSIGKVVKPSKGDFYDGPFSFIYSSRNRKRKWNEVSFTIQAACQHAPLHPSSPDPIKIGKDKWKIKKGSRRMSLTECATIQTFSKRRINNIRKSANSLYSRFELVGDAVPPLMAEKIATSMLNSL